MEGLRLGAQGADAGIHAAFDHDFAKLAESGEMDRRAVEAIGEASEGSEKQFIVTAGLPVTAGQIVVDPRLAEAPHPRARTA